MTARLIKKRSEKTGLPPGTLIHIGEQKAEKTRIRLIDYDLNKFEEKEVGSIEECFPCKDSSTVSWINIDGLHEVEVIEKIGKHFGLHPLLLEDVVNTAQRPKLEDYGKYLFIVLKMLYYDEEEHIIIAEQVSLILFPNLVITFQEGVGDVFNPVRERIRHGRGRIRGSGADYLAYALMDAVVDNYFIILERIGERIEEIEEELVANPGQETLQKIHLLKREMIFLRKSIWPLRELISGLDRGDSPLIEKATETYLRDLYDHTIQVIDTVETFRDVVSGMLDIYLSSVGNRMNEIMKVLTMIATLFIPLTFIAGIYGMNFEHMPELGKKWGYPAVLMLMVILGSIMVTYFRRKKWL
jgi:magnesium transporter